VSASRKRGRRRSEPTPPQPLEPPPQQQKAPTLAALVRAVLPDTSWEQARTLCRGGGVRVDGRLATDPAARPAPGCRVEVLPVAAGPGGAAEGTATREGRKESLVVYADADVVVVRKPPGMLTVPFERRDRDTLLALTRVALRRIERRRLGHGAGAAGLLATNAPVVPGDPHGSGGPGGPGRQAAARPPAAGTGTGANPTLRAVQRLDKDTSGLLVFARNVPAQRELQLQLARREVTRRYEALVHGAAEDAVYDSWLVEDRGDGLRGSWPTGPPGPTGPLGPPGPAEPGPPPAPGARRAVTRVLVLERLRGATLVACELATGRRHQIRIHLAEAGHPLVGETVYVRDYRGPRLPAPRPMLHAAVLGFRHPRDGRPLRFEEPPPHDFAEVLERLRPRNPGPRVGVVRAGRDRPGRRP
jgi:23S rRNA pseudouridine1911/1915/1917 synthase